MMVSVKRSWFITRALAVVLALLATAALQSLQTSACGVRRIGPRLKAASGYDQQADTLDEQPVRTARTTRKTRKGSP